MRRRRRFHASARRAGDGMHVDIAVEQQVACQRKQRQLNGCGETSWVGNVLAADNVFAVELRQPVDEVVRAVVDAEVLREVDNAHLLRDFRSVRLHEFARFAVGRAEENHVDIGKRCCRCKHQIGVAHKPLMHGSHWVAGIACAVHPFKVYVGVVEQQSDEFAGGVSGTSNYSSLYHICSSLWLA